MKRGVRWLKFLGIGVLALLLVFFVMVVVPFRKISFPIKDYEVLIIENISIVDVRNDTIIPGQNILIRGQTIQSISAEPIVKETAGADRTKVIDGTNQFLIPALWDMHVHLTKHSPAIAYPAFIQHGITHVRDMRGAYHDRDPFAGVQSKLENWNRDVQEYKLVGPRLHGYTSFAVDGPHTMFEGLPDFYNCRTPEEATRLVAFFKKKNVTLIKVYNNIPRASFFTLMKEAKSAGIEVAGHKPMSVSTVEAANAGMKSLEHARFIIWDSFSGADSLISAYQPPYRVNTQMRLRMLREHDISKLREIFDAFKRNNTWYCPTHLTRRDEAFAGDENYRSRYDSINPILRLLSMEDLDAVVKEDTTAQGRKAFFDFYTRGLELSGKASSAGIKILAGSDVPELPGSSLHEELMELTKAGLPPFEMLRTATLYPAQYYGLDSEYGSIEPGKKADMVILSASPVLSARNTRSISGVIFDGRYQDANALSNLREKVATRSKSIVMSAKLVWDMLIYLTL
jgi:imidazolonepropionase-like amidohydrolase